LPVSPTKLRFSRLQKTCDIINAGSKGRCVAFCYKAKVEDTLILLGYA